MSQKTTIDELQVLITANAASFNKQLQAVQRQLDGLDKNTKSSSKSFLGSMNGMKVAVLAAAAAITIAMSKAIASSTRFFGDFEQNTGGAKAIFGDYAGFVQKKAWEAAHAMGMSANEYLQTANKIGAIMQGSGLTQVQSLKMTTEWMQRAADQASVMGVSTSEAMMAITGAAKGNFTMMDNIGVKMSATTLETYALSKGIRTTFENMTEAQKIGLAYELFLERTNYAAGNFAREGATTMNGALATLRANFKNLGVMLGQAFAPVILQVSQFVSNYLIPALQSVIPYVIGFMQVVGQAVSYIGGLLSNLFRGGASNVKAITTATEAAASGVNSVQGAAIGAGKALGGAAKQAKKLKGQLAGFDEMNVITEPQTNSGGGGGGAGGGGSVPDFNIPKPDFNPFEEIKNKAKEVSDFVKNVFRSASEHIGGFFSKTIDRIRRLFGKLGDIGSKTVEFIKNSWQKHGQSIVTNFGKMLGGMQNLSDSIGGYILAPFDGFINGFSNRWSIIGQSATDAFSNIISQAMLFTGELSTQLSRPFDTLALSLETGGNNIGQFMAQWLTDWIIAIDMNLPTISENFLKLTDSITNNLSTLSSIAGGIWEGFTGSIKKNWDIYGKDIADGVIKTIGNIIDTFKRIQTEILDPIIQPFLNEFKKVWDEHIQGMIDEIIKFVMVLIKNATEIYNKFIKPITDFLISFLSPIFVAVFGAIGGIINDFLRVASSVIKSVIGVFRGMLDFITGIFTGNWKQAWEGIKTVFSNIASGLGNIFKAPINFIISIINGFIRGLNKIKIPDWVPAVGGKGISIPEIPKLARGGLVSSTTIAMIGEAGREAVLPLDRNTGWMDELAAKINGNNNTPINITVQVGDEVLLEKVINGINDLSFVRNRNVINI